MFNSEEMWWMRYIGERVTDSLRKFQDMTKLEMGEKLAPAMGVNAGTASGYISYAKNGEVIFSGYGQEALANRARWLSVLFYGLCTVEDDEVVETARKLFKSVGSKFTYPPQEGSRIRLNAPDPQSPLEAKIRKLKEKDAKIVEGLVDSILESYEA